MNNKLKYLIISLLGIVAIIYFYNKYRVAPGIDLERLSLKNMEGQPVKLSDFKGKKIILAFSASWCGNCIVELRALNSIRDKELSDVEIIVVSDEPIETVSAFKDKKGYPFVFLKLEQSFASLGINAIPTNYILNKDFEVKYEKVGEIDWKDPSTLNYMKSLLN